MLHPDRGAAQDTAEGRAEATTKAATAAAAAAATTAAAAGVVRRGDREGCHHALHAAAGSDLRPQCIPAGEIDTTLNLHYQWQPNDNEY